MSVPDGKRKNISSATESIANVAMRQSESQETIHDATTQSKNAQSPKSRHNGYMYLNTANLKTILRYTNAVPYKIDHGYFYYYCFYCTAKFTDPQDLREHNRTEHGDAESLIAKIKNTAFTFNLDVVDLQCKLCKAKIENLDEFRDHLEQKHDNIKLYKVEKNLIIEFKLSKDSFVCFYCHKTYNNMKSLREHSHKHFPNFKCDLCDAVFPNLRASQQHTTKHNLQKEVLECRHCGKKFGNKTNRRQHERLVHETKDKVGRNCNQCGGTYASYRDRNMHLTEVHGVPIPYPCNACGKGFFLRAELTNHTRRNHLLERPYQCEYCYKSFYKRKELVIHTVTHTKEKNFQCTECNKSFGTSKTLKRHLGVHFADLRIKCKFCGAVFIRQKGLDVHLKAKHEGSV